jgi:hypothetical protein
MSQTETIATQAPEAGPASQQEAATERTEMAALVGTRCGPQLPFCCDIQFFPMPGGYFCVDVVVDNNGNPAAVLEAASPFDIRGRIGIFAGNVITGAATVTIYADQLGGTVDQAIGAVQVNITGDGVYRWTVTIPGGTLPDAPAGGSNLYRLAAVLTMKNSSGVQTETSSFAEIGTFRIA